MDKVAILDRHYTLILNDNFRKIRQLQNKLSKAITRLMEMNDPEAMESHTTQRYWKTVRDVEFYEAELKKLIDETNLIMIMYDVRNNLHQERFNFIKTLDF